MRKFLLVVALLVAAWWVFSGDERFACADDGACPSSVDGASGDARWARDRYESIRTESLTAGLFYDGDGHQHEFSSGDEDISERIEDLLRSSRRVSMPAVGRHPTVTHVEPKVAMRMREGEVDRGVLVINHPEGPCPGVFSCSRTIEVVLPHGAALTVWWPDGDTMTSMTFVGKD